MAPVDQYRLTSARNFCCPYVAPPRSGTEGCSGNPLERPLPADALARWSQANVDFTPTREESNHAF